MARDSDRFLTGRAANAVITTFTTHKCWASDFTFGERWQSGSVDLSITPNYSHFPRGYEVLKALEATPEDGGTGLAIGLAG